jgi:hypothetical protein
MKHLESFQNYNIQDLEPTNESLRRIIGLLLKELRRKFTPKWLRPKPLPKAPKLNFKPNIGLLDPHKKQIVTEFHGVVEGMLGKETADRIASTFTDASIVTGVEGKKLVDWVGKEIRPKLASAREGSEGIYMDELLNLLSAFKEGKMTADEILKYLPENLAGGSVFRKNVYDSLLKATKSADDVADLPLWQKLAMNKGSEPAKRGRVLGGAAAELSQKPANLVMLGRHLPNRISNRWFDANVKYINFDIMKAGNSGIDNIQKLNRAISLSIETKNFNYIPSKGFEKLGFPEPFSFRNFLKSQVLDADATINRIDSKSGEWSLTFKFD